MDFLVLGGTQFVGRTIVKTLLSNGHRVTLLHRGNTNPELFPECEHLLTDRLEIEQFDLGERRWDAIVDVSGYIPRAMTTAINALKGRAEQYLFISTISVYDVQAGERDIREDHRVLELADPTVEKVDGETYGGLKVLCERTLESDWSGTVTIVRPGLIVGPFDHTDRLTYWLEHIRRGQRREPVGIDQPLQVIDARDLAGLVLNLLQSQTPGTFNAVGPATPMSFRQVLDLAVQTLNPAAALTPGDYAKPLDMEGDTEREGIMVVNWEAAKAAGLRHRPLAETMRDAVAWFQEQGRDLKF
ncbi:MAG: NAD-dependent epimerase/dehydratase family protein [Chthonomonas sp.]|nr:NAD-dependent epimerase/dehydratase family protein [Chthonomonas sp.]